jgi:hypothetical protein
LQPLRPNSNNNQPKHSPTNLPRLSPPKPNLITKKERDKPSSSSRTMRRRRMIRKMETRMAVLREGRALH